MRLPAETRISAARVPALANPPTITALGNLPDHAEPALAKVVRSEGVSGRSALCGEMYAPFQASLSMRESWCDEVLVLSRRTGICPKALLSKLPKSKRKG